MTKNDLNFNARIFLKQHPFGILSTISQTVDQYPYGSVCPFMLDFQARPIIFVSDIAHHTKNFKHNDKVCLTVMDESKKNRHEGARVSYLGNMTPLNQDELGYMEERYLRLFPEARTYYQAHDFAYYRIEPKRLRFIEGFGKIHWIESKNILVDVTGFQELESQVITHMNNDHRDALLNYCKHYHHVSCDEAELVTVDTDGFMIKTPLDNYYCSFSRSCLSLDDLHQEMVRMAREAKESKNE